jgi:hypothetical protein
MAIHLVVWLAALPELLADKASHKSHRPLPENTDLVGYGRRQREVRGLLIAALHPFVVASKHKTTGLPPPSSSPPPTVVGRDFAWPSGTAGIDTACRACPIIPAARARSARHLWLEGWR